MRKLTATFLIVLTAFTGEVLAQSASDTQGRPAGARAQNSIARESAQPGAPSTGRQRLGAQSTTTTTRVSTESGNLDQQIPACLTLGNKEEIALAQFAQERAQSPQVKQFAQMMIEEHQQAVSQLEKAVPQLASLNLQLKGAEGAETAATTSGQTGDDRTAATGGAQRTPSAAQGGLEQQMLELGREIKEQCLALTQAELGKKQGADFDKCYIGQQLVAHTGMLAELKASQRHASSQLQPVLQQGAQMAEHHLAQARTIAEQLEAAQGANPPQTTQRPGATKPPRR